MFNNIFSWVSCSVLIGLFVYYVFVAYKHYFGKTIGVVELVPISNISKIRHILLYYKLIQEIYDMLDKDTGFLKEDWLVAFEKYIS